MQQDYKIHLFVHVVCATNGRAPLLKKPVRNVLFVQIKNEAEEKLANVLCINGVEDHIHCLLRIHPMQSLSQVMKSIKENAARFLNENKLLNTLFEWEDGYAAYSVSPTNIKQVSDYILKQDEYHKTRSLESELEMFEKMSVWTA
jgi:putative transposase